MLRIHKQDFQFNGEWFDFRLMDGTMLHKSEWNGEYYTVEEDGKEVTYIPIYSDDENSNGGYDIIGFERR